MMTLNDADRSKAAAWAAAEAAKAARKVARVAAEATQDDYWRAIDPPGLLRRLINVEQQK